MKTSTTTPIKLTKSQIAAEAQIAARVEHERRFALSNLGHKACRVRKLDYDATCKLLEGLRDGSVTIDPADLDREVETYLTTVRCHERCKAWVREYGYAPYKANPESGYSIDPMLCEVCATPLECKNPDGNHTYVSLSVAECHARGIYHGGNCYHVSVCTGCGNVNSVDSSD